MPPDITPFPPLSPHEVHVWHVDIEHPSAPLEVLAECLSDEERQRAGRFLRESARRHYTVSHAAVRGILGQYLKIPPNHVDFAFRAGGKPELVSLAETTLSPFAQRKSRSNHAAFAERKATIHASKLRFNLSHSGELALVAVTLDRELGIDVEHIRPMHDMEGIVGRFFAPGEQVAWRALPANDRMTGFFRCWTRKEAYLKARGIGLSGGLDRFEVSLAPDAPACLLQVGDPADSIQRWQMFDVSPGDGYLAACVVECGIEKISVYNWLGMPH